MGVAILDTGSGRRYGYRADERFMILSTFKLLACALVLQRVDAGLASLDQRIAYTRDDLVASSVVTEQHADGEGMTLGSLCEAAITKTDNTAANLILSTYGGPAALTAYARALEDDITRLDRLETDLNVTGADPLLDTTSPAAMVGTMEKLVLGETLSPPSRRQLQQWLLDNTTGTRRLKVGLPPDWQLGDKTGTNTTSANDIGVVWPPHRAPLVVAAYLSDSTATSQVKDAIIAAVGTLVADIAV